MLYSSLHLPWQHPPPLLTRNANACGLGGACNMDFGSCLLVTRLFGSCLKRRHPLHAAPDATSGTGKTRKRARACGASTGSDPAQPLLPSKTPPTPLFIFFPHYRLLSGRRPTRRGSATRSPHPRARSRSPRPAPARPGPSPGGGAVPPRPASPPPRPTIPGMRGPPPPPPNFRRALPCRAGRREPLR